MTKRVYQQLEKIKGHMDMLKKLAIYPDDILKQKAVEFTLEELATGGHRAICDTMFRVMYHFGGIGLSANQANYLKRIVIMDTGNEFVCSDAITNCRIEPHKVVAINPEILEFSKDETKLEEGCLSLPDIKVNVKRPETIKVRFLDENLNERVYYMSGLLAKCMQHEIDHLNGILIVDKLSFETRRVLFQKKLVNLAQTSRELPNQTA